MPYQTTLNQKPTILLCSLGSFFLNPWVEPEDKIEAERVPKGSSESGNAASERGYFSHTNGTVRGVGPTMSIHWSGRQAQKCLA